MVRMGRDETMSPGTVMWAMDQVADRYAQKDGQTLQAAGKQRMQIFLRSRCSSCLIALVPLIAKEVVLQ